MLKTHPIFLHYYTRMGTEKSVPAVIEKDRLGNEISFVEVLIQAGEEISVRVY